MPIPCNMQIVTYVSINLELRCYSLGFRDTKQNKEEKERKHICETLRKISVQIYFEETFRNLHDYLELLNLKAHQSQLSSGFVSILLWVRGGK